MYYDTTLLFTSLRRNQAETGEICKDSWEQHILRTARVAGGFRDLRD